MKNTDKIFAPQMQELFQNFKNRFIQLILLSQSLSSFNLTTFSLLLLNAQADT